jgi:D-alanyl-D-alanine carboxypeptidase
MLFNRPQRKGRISALVVSVALAAVLASSCGTAGFKPALENKLSGRLSDWMKRFDIPGAVVGIWQPGTGEWVTAQGKACIAEAEAMKPGLRFRVGSITKTFTATVILTLVDDGKLSLNDKVSRYVSGVPAGEQITIRMLCNNTSGLFNYGEDPQFVENLVAEPRRKYTPRELVDFAASRPAYFPPGEGWHNFILLGMIIEKLTGASVAEAYEKRIIEPLGLADTYFAEGYAIKGDYAHGYAEAQDGSGKLEDYTEWLDMSVDWTAGAMVSNLWDLKTWAKAFATGELLEPATRKEQLTTVKMSDSEPFSKYGLGLFTMDSFVGHDGMVPGNCAMLYEPADGSTYVLLFNKSQAESLALAAFMGLTREVLGGKTPW